MDGNMIVSGFIQINNELISADNIEPLSERSGSTCLCYMVRYLGKRYFMKRLRREYADNPRYQELFRKEFETGQHLTHEHLVKYVSMGEDVDGCYIVMEYIDGETLGERMKNDPSFFAEPFRVRRLFTQLLSCLAYLHHHQVLHLDLKLDNIMLTRISDDVKLIDLGFCYSDSYDLSMGCNGIFSAPEQNEGRIQDINVGTDLYAVGLLLGNVCLLHPKIYENAAISDLVARSTHIDLSHRFRSAEEMACAIKQVFPDDYGNVGRKSRTRALSSIVGLSLFLGGVAAWHFIDGIIEQEKPVLFDSNGISYSIVSPESFTCTTIGRANSPSDKPMTIVSIKPVVVHDDVRYRVVSVGDSTFYSDSILQVLSISEGIERLSYNACTGCRNLHTVSLPLSLKSIGESAFSRCHSLKHIILPPYIDRLPIGMFEECSSLETIHFPEGLESIGRGCFASSGLTMIQLPDSLRSLEQGVFLNCRSLRSVTLPASLERIGDFCFHGCDSLVEVRNYSETPQPIIDVFGSALGLKRTLYVPHQSIDLYRNAPYWRDFSHILPL